MQKRSTIIIEILIVFIGIGSIAYYKFYLFPRHKIPTAIQNVPQNAVLIDPNLYSLISVKEQPEFSIIDVEYPFFDQASQEFNSKIKDYVQAKIAEHNTVAKENWKSRFGNSFSEKNFPNKPLAEEDKMPFFMKTEIVQANPNYISFVLDYATYQAGIPGKEEIVSFNYDVKTEEDITLKSFFNNDPLYLEDISRFVRKDLEDQLINKEALADLGLTKDTQDRYVEDMTKGIEAGTKAVLTNFNTFTFTPDALTFYFQDYQVGPHSIGLPRSIMPRR